MAEEAGPAPSSRAKIPIMQPWLGDEEVTAAAATVASGWVAQGPRVAEFEEAFAEEVGTQHAVAVSSCTTGLHLVLAANGIGRGDRVVVPSLSFIASANAVRHTGAEPVFADVDAATLNLTRATIEPVITPRVRAVMVVHQVGTPADLDDIRTICDERAVILIEDAACAAGTTYHGRPIGDGHSPAVFSFHPRKIITTGEGGMIVTADGDLAGRLRRLREHGMDVTASTRHAIDAVIIERYLETGFNYRMTDIQAAIGLAQLKKLEEIVSRRRHLATRYQQLLANLGFAEYATDPRWGTSNFQSFWVALPDADVDRRNAVLRHLLRSGISARRGIMASHLEPAYASVVQSPLPVTESMTARSLILPLYHTMTEDDQDHVVAVLDEAVTRS